jgi:hypothetical protein
MFLTQKIFLSLHVWAGWRPKLRMSALTRL